MTRTAIHRLRPFFAGFLLVQTVTGQEPKSIERTERAPLRLQVPADLHLELGGVLGQRIEANLRNWLLVAPAANPGLTEMFRVRDRLPAPQCVDWAGEFVGKYLISAIQARRMVHSPELEGVIRQVVDELLAAQSEDGYLGPFKKDERLLGHWDLWGHYHVMLGLLMVSEEMNDRRSLEAACRAADLICSTYLDGRRSVFDAGSQEMNMAVIHGFGRLYRITGRERYLQMIRQIENEWSRAGDYFRKGRAGVDFHRTPRPRWESLHDVQGLLELYRITGQPDYSTAFTNLWTSIRRYDRHNSGSFSTGEGAIGSPYRPGAIETCCTSAWMALTVDMLALTADPRVADELELSTYNAVLASQHPSGRWWTYDTPMDGTRQASAHTIVFQARAGTPELNCCSVNGPRGLGMLSEWAVLEDAEGVMVNHYGPSTVHLRLKTGRRLSLVQETRYPAEETIRLTVRLDSPAEFDLRLRIPSWSTHTTLKLNDEPMPEVKSGSYYSLRRRWQTGDSIAIRLDLSPRYWTGEQEVTGKASIYRGPLLLAFDQRNNAYDCSQIPTLDLNKLELKPVPVQDTLAPIVLFDIKGTAGRSARLCDFATAGAHGNEYRSWLPAINGLPPAFELKSPANDAKIATGPVRFEWVGFSSGRPEDTSYDLIVARDAQFREPLFKAEQIRRPQFRREDLAAGSYFWKVVARNASGEQENQFGASGFTVDASLPARSQPALTTYGENRVIIEAELNGTGEPVHGQLTAAVHVQPAADRQGMAGGAVGFNGQDAKLQYAVTAFPEEDYSVCAWIYVEKFSEKMYQQVFSAWTKGMDDPLRIAVMGDSLQARIEAGQSYATPAVKLEAGRWIHVAAVKEGPELRLYVNGKLGGQTAVPEFIDSSSQSVALGGNPGFSGDEYFQGRMDAFSFHATALSAEQIQKLAEGAVR